MLSALVKHRHYDSNTSCLTAHCGNNTFQILIVVIRTHMIFNSVHFIGNTVIEHVAYDIHVMTSYSFIDNAFSFACTKSRTSYMSNISFCILITSKSSKIFINLSRYAFTAFHTYDTKLADYRCFVTYKVVCHCNSPSYWICIKFSLSLTVFVRLRPYFTFTLQIYHK